MMMSGREDEEDLSDEEVIDLNDLSYLKKGERRGYLLKRSSNDHAVWKKRYCILTDKLWVVDVGHREPRALSINISSPIVVSMSEVKSKSRQDVSTISLLATNLEHPYEFNIGVSNGTLHYFRAASKSEQIGWYDDLMAHSLLASENDAFQMAELIMSEENRMKTERLHSCFQSVMHTPLCQRAFHTAHLDTRAMLTDKGHELKKRSERRKYSNSPGNLSQERNKDDTASINKVTRVRASTSSSASADITALSVDGRMSEASISPRARSNTSGATIQAPPSSSSGEGNKFTRKKQYLNHQEYLKQLLRQESINIVDKVPSITSHYYLKAKDPNYWRIPNTEMINVNDSSSDQDSDTDTEIDAEHGVGEDTSNSNFISSKTEDDDYDHMEDLLGGMKQKLEALHNSSDKKVLRCSDSIILEIAKMEPHLSNAFQLEYDVNKFKELLRHDLEVTSRVQWIHAMMIFNCYFVPHLLITDEAKTESVKKEMKPIWVPSISLIRKVRDSLMTNVVLHNGYGCGSIASPVSPPSIALQQQQLKLKEQLKKDRNTTGRLKTGNAQSRTASREREHESENTAFERALNQTDSLGFWGSLFGGGVSIDDSNNASLQVNHVVDSTGGAAVEYIDVSFYVNEPWSQKTTQVHQVFSIKDPITRPILNMFDDALSDCRSTVENCT